MWSRGYLAQPVLLQPGMLVFLPVLVCLAAVFLACLPPHELQLDELTGDGRQLLPARQVLPSPPRATAGIREPSRLAQRVL